MVILAIWLALSGTIYSQIALFALNRIFFSANENETVEQNNQNGFKMDVIKWQLTSGRAILIWNHTCDFKPNNFEITSIISDQIALHSVQWSLIN